MDAHPDNAVDGAELLKKLCQLPLAVEIDAVAARILRDDDELFHAALRQILRFFHELFHRAAAVPAAELRDDAERAVVVAALRDAQIRVVLGRGQNALGLGQVRVDVAELRDHLAGEDFPDRRNDVIIRARAKHAVYLRHFLHDLHLIALGKTSGHKDLPDSIFLFELAHRQNVVDGFRLCVFNKAAGVDDHQIRAVRVGQNLIARHAQQKQHLLGVDLIFGAAEADHANCLAHSISSQVSMGSQSASNRRSPS